MICIIVYCFCLFCHYVKCLFDVVHVFVTVYGFSFYVFCVMCFYVNVVSVSVFAVWLHINMLIAAD